MELERDLDRLVGTAGEAVTVPGLTVGGVARRLGVAPATLRTWARRYGMGPTSHVAGSHRRYSTEDVARLDLMRRMVDAGVTPGDAARAARSASGEMLRRQVGERGAAAGADATPPTSGDAPAIRETGERPDVVVDPPAELDGDIPPALAFRRIEPAAPPDALDLQELAERTRPLASVHAVSPGPPAAGELARAVLALDGAGAVAVIADRIDSRGVVWTWDHLLAPILIGLGNRWEHSGVGVEVEHVLTEAVTVAMAAVWSGPYQHRNARPVLLACAPDEQHSLVLRVVAAALAERRIYAQPIGIGLPTKALVSAVRRAGPSVVLVWSSREDAADAADLTALVGLRPTPLVLTAGPGWRRVPEGSRRVTSLDEVVAQVEEVVG